MVYTTFHWAAVAPAVTAAFLASLVEFVEAFTVVLAVGTVCGWREALTGCVAALLVLTGSIVGLGSALTKIPLRLMQLLCGSLLLVFGVHWLRKAILRSAGLMHLHDENAIFAAQVSRLQHDQRHRVGLDKMAFLSTFKITLLEGTEVVFIVLNVGAARPGLLLPASLAALTALLLVLLLGLFLHRPLSRIPENQLKFSVGILLSTMGSFWLGEGLGFHWPAGDWSLAGLLSALLILATGYRQLLITSVKKSTKD